MNSEILDLIESHNSIELAQAAYQLSDELKQYRRYIIATLIDRGDYGYYEQLCIDCSAVN